MTDPLRYYKALDGSLFKAYESPGDDYTDLGEVPVDQEQTPEILDEDGTTIITDTEYYWGELRRKRDALLAATDPTQLADKDPTYQTDWAAYRQDLKDMPEFIVDPTDVTWPTPPDDDELDLLVRGFNNVQTYLSGLQGSNVRLLTI